MARPPPQTGESGAHAERFELTTLWEVVRDCRARIAKTFSYLDPEMGEALALVVSELAENVVKYGALETEAPPAMTIHVAPERIVVRSENVARSEYDARLACRLVAKVAADLEQLGPDEAYAAAIQSRLSRRSTHSRQGFYRITAVAGFRLRAERDGKCLTIVGERLL